MAKVTLLSGTSRPGNFTLRATRALAAELTQRGHTARLLDGADLMLSFPGHPETEDARRLQAAVTEADVIVLATPEYHGTFAAFLKLCLENMGFPSAIKDKPIALLGVAAGRIGAIKSLEQLRGVCAHMGALVLPGAVSLAGVNRLFDDEGSLTDEQAAKALAGLADRVDGFVQQHLLPAVCLEAEVRNDGEGWSAAV